MLDRTLLMQEFQKKANLLFYQADDQIAYAYQLWQEVTHNPDYAHLLPIKSSSLSIPHWHGSLTDYHTHAALQDAYYVASIDGSQIYPDRHQGINCFLINIGVTTFDYGKGSFNGVSIPYVFAAHEYDQGNEIVDYLRNDYERYSIFDCTLPSDMYTSLLLDGCLLQHEFKDNDVGSFFEQRYTAFLYTLYQRHIMAAWYISAPRYKEVIRLLYAHLGADSLDKKKYQAIDQVTDAMLMARILRPCERSTIFFYQDPSSQKIPFAASACFFYMHVGSEIVRIELPIYIALNEQYCSLLCSIILDQVHKGQGYPIALSEAHEQAVVDTQDRTFFYAALDMLGLQYNKKILLTPKQIKKNIVGI